MSKDFVSILEGNTFVVSDRSGNIDASPTQTTGLFHTDMRFLSRWILTINGQRPGVLSTDDLQYFAAQFFLVPGTGTVYVDSPLAIVRKRVVSSGFLEYLSIANESQKAMELEVRMEAGADFADLFEVKDALRKKGETYAKVEGQKLILGYRRETFVRETWITSSAQARIDEQGFSFKIRIRPHGKWETSFEVSTAKDGYRDHPPKPKYYSAEDAPKPNMGVTLEKWLERAPVLKAAWPPLEQIYRRSLVDLAALRFYSFMFPKNSLPAAGLPWFMAIFGRDSLITSFQALPFESELAATTLKLLGARQGAVVDDFRDEEPGRILHEVRLGEMTAFEERPHSPYFGSADATMLFLILLDEYEKWTGDSQLVLGLEKEARALTTKVLPSNMLTKSLLITLLSAEISPQSGSGAPRKIFGR